MTFARDMDPSLEDCARFRLASGEKTGSEDEKLNHIRVELYKLNVYGLFSNDYNRNRLTDVDSNSSQVLDHSSSLIKIHLVLRRCSAPSFSCQLNSRVDS